MNDDRFFREVTLRLCGNLDIERALAEGLRFIRSKIPADSIWLELLEPRLSSLRVVAKATVEGGWTQDLLIPLPEPAASEMKQGSDQILADELPVQWVNRPSESPVTEALLQQLELPPSSCLGLSIVVNGEIAGGVVLVAQGLDRYTEEHARLFSMLRSPFNIATANYLQHQEVRRLRDRLVEDNRLLYQELHQHRGDQIVGAEFGLRRVMEQVNQVAPTASPVLLQGETGVGKDVIAHAIHDRSPRRKRPFVVVNCGAIPDSLVDSELFGHERGAFTGALDRKRGRFERADEGTIFLDEIGELPPATQVRLLRVIQNRELERVGGSETIELDIRIIAATHRNLASMVREGTFREDLWFRLNVFPVTIPPLRERLEDIPALLQFFIERKSRELKLHETPRLGRGSLAALRSYDWPGNVRELENLVERALILRRDGEFQPDTLLPLVSPCRDTQETVAASAAADSEILSLEEINRRHIQRVLELTGGQIHGRGGAAELLGINPSTLRSRIKKLGI